MKTCKKCGYEGNNFTERDLTGYCRPCKSKANKRNNPKMVSNRHESYNKPYPDVENAKCVYEFYYDDGTSAYVGETKNGS